MDRADIVAAMQMAPDAAVAFLRSKGLQVSEHWQDLWRSAHARAFTVARSAGFDVLEDIRDGLLEAIEQGQSYKQFSENLNPLLQAKGWWGKAVDRKSGEIIKSYQGGSAPVEYGSPRRLKLIYEQNLQTAFMAGRYRGMKDAVTTHPFWQYVAVLDNRTRPGHRAMHGRVFRHDDVAWDIAYPPNGWHCRCRVRPLSNSALQEEGLTVGTGNDYIEQVTFGQKDGTKILVNRLNLPGLAKPFQPDLGWDYNPAVDYHNGSINLQP